MIHAISANTGVHDDGNPPGKIPCTAKIAMHIKSSSSESRSACEHSHGGKTRPKPATSSKTPLTTADVHQVDSSEEHPVFTDKVRHIALDYYSYISEFEMVSPPKLGFDSDCLILQPDVNDQSDLLKKYDLYMASP